MENYHIFSVRKVRFILKTMCSMYYKNILLERSQAFVLKLDFLHLFSDSISKTPGKYKTIPCLKLVPKKKFSF